MSEKYTPVWFMLFLAIFYTSTLQANQTGPQRIITLSPHLAELVFLLGAGDEIHGVSEYSDYPETVADIPRIGGAAGVDVERILSITPDHILAWQGGTRENDIRKLQELGLKVVSIKGETLDDIPDSIRIIGDLLNRQNKASELIGQFNEKLLQITRQYRNLPHHRIFIEISSQPLMGLTDRHSFSAGLALCGLDNIFSNEEKPTIVTDLESVLSRNTEYVLLRSRISGNDFLSRKPSYQIDEDKAVEFVSFDEDVAFRQTPRLLDTIADVCNEIHTR